MYVNRQRSIIVFFVMIFALSFSYYQASAQVNFTTNEAQFDIDHPTLSVQDFQVANAPGLGSISCDAPVNANSDDACFSPGEILPGIQFLDNPGPEVGGVIVIGANFNGTGGNPPNLLSNNTFADSYDVEFTGSTDTVGLRLGCVRSGSLCARNIVVSVFGAMDSLLGSSNIAVTEAADAFIGIESQDPITRINLEFDGPQDGEVKAINDIKFNSTPLVQIVDVNNGACSLTKSNLNALKIEGATPNKKVAVVMGLKYGSLIINGPVCNGLELGVKQAQIFAIAKADELGNLMFQAPVPPLGDQVNLGFFQVVDVSTCTASEVSMYDILIDEIQTNDNDGDGVVNCQDACPEQGLPNPMFDETLGADGCIESPCDVRTEVSYDGSCYYLDGSGGSCLLGYQLAPQSVLNTIAPGFIGRDYKTMVSGNCCIWHSEQDIEGQDWGMADFIMDPNGNGECGQPGPFEIGPLLGGANCTDSLNLNENQLTLCVSQEIIID